MAGHDWHPLRFDLKGHVAQLLAEHPRFSFPDILVQYSRTGSIKTTDVLDALARLLAFPALTEEVSTRFRPLLMDLCARWIGMNDLEDHKVFEAFAALLRPHREIFPIMEEYLAHPSRNDGPLAFISSSAVAELPARPLHRLLTTYYRLLLEDDLFPQRRGWSLTPLTQLVKTPHPDPGVRVLAILCYSLQAAMSEATREKTYWESLGEPGGIDAPIEIGERLVEDVAVPIEADSWIIGFSEEQRRVAQRAALSNPQNYYLPEDQPSHITPEDLSLHIVDVSGILTFKRDPSSPTKSRLVITPSVGNTLRNLALFLSDRLPTLIISPPGAGKSLIIHHLASQLFPSSPSHVISLHLSDTSIDPKSLLGSYVPSSTKPGTFEWIEGPLCAAMRAGKWLVLEDIDKASPEVLGTILPLVESLGTSKGPGDPASISIPGRNIAVKAAASFALFATRSVAAVIPSNEDGSGPSHLSTFIGSHHWFEVHLPAPKADEQEAILCSLFPQLSPPAVHHLVRIFEAVRSAASSGLTVSRTSKSQSIGLRDLIKWTRRVEHYFPARKPRDDNAMDVDDGEEGTGEAEAAARVFANPEVKDRIFLEASDIFFGSAPRTSLVAASPSVSLAALVAEQLNLSIEQAEWTLGTRTPELHIERSPSSGAVTSLRIGRTTLFARPSAAHTPLPQANATTKSFALHRPSLVLLEQLATAARFAEPLLLVGETGTGKTTAIQHIASLLSHPLTVFNLSNQTEVSDLVGGFKPVDARVPGTTLQGRFTALFGGTFSARKNVEFEGAARKAVLGSKWKRAVAMWREAAGKAVARIHEVSRDQLDSDAPRKRRKVETQQPDPTLPTVTEEEWADFGRAVDAFEAQHIVGKAKFAFAFVEGPLVRAIRDGHWVLLDEINLASPETLEAIGPLLQSPTASLTLTEQGSLEPVPRHPSFRLFASMNPATDVGKKDLPPVMRSAFTELWVPPPDSVREALIAIIQQRIGHVALSDRSIILDVAEFYEGIRKLSDARQISDGSNQRPHFSMRTLTRALTFAVDVAPSFGLRRAVWEGCLMAFTMTLDARSAELVRPLAERHLLAGKNKGAFLSQLPAHIGDSDEHITVGAFRIARGPLPPDPMESYILTPSVQAKLVDLARIVCTRRFPVLIEGPTSAGKTSSIEYLARRTGHNFVRINNHEHTDIQEYIGTYVSDPNTGKLVFRDGVLVRALRQGHWLVLDELNLAPTDVLEALNRLLDDNRELLVPETQEVVTPHPNFMLFATQNPPGLYAGRKVLSRAFRNRFLEVHFEDVPRAELETIIHQRCRIAPSYAQKLVAVFRELQSRRQTGRVFESKHGFATLRDLFRWAGRGAVGYQQLAEDGYMLLAERARQPEDKAAVKEAIESVMKVTINATVLYDISSGEGTPAGRLGLTFSQSSELIWTSAFERLFVLVATSLKNHEPVLLVGDTGAGKTSVCQFLADVLNRELHTLNCHQNTETADLLGGQRPVRNRSALKAEARTVAAATLKECGVNVNPDDVDALNGALDKALQQKERPATDLERLRLARRALRRAESLFEWSDGPLVAAMTRGHVFLMDEISLADDSVLERLNSVLEAERTLVLAEKGGWGDDNKIIAADGFELIATMNPGGDYGKKELSPALRNRFTEIWVPQIDLRQDRKQILDSMWRHSELRSMSDHILDFAEWLATEVGDRSILGLRDFQAWVGFSNATFERYSGSLSPAEIFYHAARMTVLDGLATLPHLSALSSEALRRLESRAVENIHRLVSQTATATEALPQRLRPSHDSDTFVLGPFKLNLGAVSPATPKFSLEAPTAYENAMRVIRACQVPKPILLEGSPGVGKTSLITALAAFTGHRLCRVNLSDQSDIMDLFGSDLPVEGGRPGEFEWRDAAFLRALQEGDWVLLDEMNLAPQAVLEGLNAVLDHRGSVFIPELGRTFVRHPDFRIFAAQNPLGQGGGRKGLPKSFLNRFTKVYVQELSADDLLIVCQRDSPGIPLDTLRAMITFNTRIQEETVVKRTIGMDGAPWEFNLRDVLRWLRLSRLRARSGRQFDPSTHLGTVYLRRFRSEKDRVRVSAIFQEIFPNLPVHSGNPRPSTTPTLLQIGHTSLEPGFQGLRRSPSLLLHQQLAQLEASGDCLSQGWLVILVGTHGSGKTSLAKLVADQSGYPLEVISMNASIDTTDLIGNFEQVDGSHELSSLVGDVLHHWDAASSDALSGATSELDQAVRSLRSSTTLPSLAPMASEVFASIKHILNYLPSSPLDDLASSLEARQTDSSAGKFDWIDGPLVQAMKLGRWVLLDNANFCNPAVLDRLNSLTESDGSLTLSERGLVQGEVQVLHPHPNFRLIMTLNPLHGELSRAMRNRGVEMFLESIRQIEDLDRLASMNNTSQASSDIRISNPAVALQLFCRGSPTEPNEPVPDRLYRGDLNRNDTVTSSMSLISDMITTTMSFPGHVAASILAQSISPLEWNRTLRSLPLLRNADCDHVRLRQILEELRDGPLFASFRLAGVTSSITNSDEYTMKNLDALNNSHYTASRLGLLGSPASTFSLNVAMILRPPLSSPPAQTPLYASVQLESGITPPGTVHPAVQWLAPVLRASRMAVQAMLESVEDQTDESRLLIDITTASNVETLCNFLYVVTTAGPFNLTAVRAISQWLAAALRGAPELFDELRGGVQELCEATALKTGHNMVTIWRALLPVEADEELLALKRALIDLPTPSNPTSKAFRRSALDYLAAVTVRPSLSASEKQELLELGRQLCSKITAPATTSSEGAYDPHKHAESGLFVGELDVLSKSLSSVQQAKHSGVIVSNALDTSRSIASLVPLRTLTWLWESPSAMNDVEHLIKAHVSAHRQWLDSVWHWGTDKSTRGPSHLMRSTLLEETVTIWEHGSIKLRDVEVEQAYVRRQHAFALLEAQKPVRTRTSSLVSLLLENILLVMSAVRDSYDDATLEQIHRHVQAFHGGEYVALAALAVSIRQSTEPTVSAALVRHLCPLLEASPALDSHDQGAWVWLGEAWTAFSRCLIDLYVPDAVLDPLAVQDCENDLSATRRTDLSGAIALLSRHEALLTGNSSNDLLRSLRHELDSHRGQGLRPLSRPSEVPRLEALFQEITRFLQQVLPRIHMHTQPTISTSDVQLAEDIVIQGSLAGFIQRLETSYAELCDLTQPLLWSLGGLRLGLAILTGSSPRVDAGRAAEASATLRSAVQSPSISAAEEGARLTSNHVAADHILHQIASVAYAAAVDADVLGRVSQLQHGFTDLTILWLRDRENERRENEAAASLYKSHKHDDSGSNDLQTEEEDLRRLFPHFAEDTDEIPLSVLSDPHVPSGQSITQGHMLDILHLHLQLFGDSTPKVSTIRPSYIHRLREAAVMCLKATPESTFDASLDDFSLPWRISILEDTFVQTQRVVLSPSKQAPNFYRDSNVFETRRALPVLRELRSRLEAIVHEWPDQMVVHHLIEQVDRITAYPVQAPVAQVLAALERLLLQTDDWERYSNRDNSLKTQQNLLIELIVQWRRLELTCWRQLLDSETVLFEDGAAEWWFRLYEMLVFGTVSAAETGNDADDGALTKHAQLCTPLIDEFMSTSPMGQFQRRLDLLHAFSRLLDLLSLRDAGHRSNALRLMSRIVRSQVVHHTFLLPHVISELSKGRDPIQKDIVDYIKLASWKDVNVYALKQSAEKTHQHLHRCIRKYRELLRRPIASVHPSPFQNQPDPPPMSSGDSFTAWHGRLLLRTTSTEGPRRFSNLPETLARYRDILQGQVASSIEDDRSSHVEEFSGEIIARIQTLSATAMPSVEDKEQRQKAIKSTVTRKRRAIGDLIKELRRLGISENPTPEVLARQQSRARLFEVAIPKHSSDPVLLDCAERSDRYYHRLIDDLQLVRDSMSTHHSDFTTRDLQRILSLTESLFANGITARQTLTDGLDSHHRLIAICSRLQSFSDDPSRHITKTGRTVAVRVRELSRRLTHVTDAVDELVARWTGAADPAVSSSCIDSLRGYVERSKPLALSIAACRHEEDLCNFLVLDEEKILATVESHLESLPEILDRCAVEDTRVSPMCRAITHWMAHHTLDSDSSSASASDQSRPPSSTDIIDTLLVVAQDLRNWSLSTSRSEDDEKLFTTKSSDIKATVAGLRHDTVLSQLTRYLSATFNPTASSSDLGRVQDELSQIRPFLESYLRVSHLILMDIARWAKSTLKLAWVVCGLVHNLAQNGLCKPPDADADSSAKSNGQSESLEGSGMGTGTGDKNISNEIEDESQVEGLQGEESAPPPPANEDGDDEGEDDAIEMGEDFEGDLEDPRDPEKDDDDAKSDEESGEEADMDEKIDDLDENDPNAVDEKLWSDEKGPEDSKSGKDQEHSAPDQEQKDDTDIVAKEDHRQKEPLDNSNDDRMDADADEAPEPEESPEGPDDAPDLPDDSEQPEQGRKLDDMLQEADTLDLPEDMNLDMDGDDMPSDAELDEDDGMEEEGSNHGSPDNEAEDVDEEPQPGAEAILQDEAEQTADHDSAEAEAETKADAVPEADESQGDGPAPQPPNDEQSGKAGPDPGARGTLPQQSQGESKSGNEQAVEEKADEEVGEVTKEDDTRPSEVEGASQNNDAPAGDGETGDARAASKGQKPSAPPPDTTPNPLKSLGDTMKNIRRRFEEISERVDATEEPLAAPPDPAEHPEDEQMEYAAPDDDNDDDMQALGPAQAQEEISKLGDLRIDDSDPQHDSHRADEPQHVEDDFEYPQAQPFNPLSAAESTTFNPDDAEDHDMDAAQATESKTSDDTLDPVIRELESEEVVSDELQRKAEEVVELELRQWQADGQPDDGARELWRRYSALTHHLAYDLCEQLRLILEPTLATRLKGDYRTGKRLNMKKVIPYIASEFTKDKIWLRRTRPSKREYQILLALDDSKSMREGRAAHLAFETMSLVLKALGRLEAGDTAVARFGETVDILHDFDSSLGAAGFSDADGAKVIQSFAFDQRATNVLSLLERSLELLADARNRKSGGSSSASDLWQLEIIISDGRCQDHEKLRAMLRRASEQRVMVVFVIVDALKSHPASGKTTANSNSILTMNQASYAMVNGKMELQLQRYLDLFPFEYYVVLRDVESLPDVLAGTLKQFFERVSEE